MKTLSDGTKAKKGMIVIVITGRSGGCNPCTITKITNLLPNTIKDNHHVEVDSEWGGMFEQLDDLRALTPREQSYFKE